MGFSLQTPLTGQPNSTEQPKEASDFTILQNWGNGNIAATDIAATSGVTRMIARTGSTSIGANSGDWILASAGVTITLPSPTLNATVAITAASGVTAASPVTVAGSSNINGLGLSSASSFPLGIPAASVILQSNGAAWFIVSGQQDSGWVTMTLGSGQLAANAGAYVPAYRKVGNRVELRGEILNTSGSLTYSGVLGTVPAPAAGVFQGNGSQGWGFTVNTSGQLGSPLFIAANSVFGLDGYSYSLI